MTKTRESNSSPTATKPRNGNGNHLQPKPTYEEIAARAYQIYRERGNAPGDPMSDWVRAERELSEKNAKPGRKPAKAAAKSAGA
jgi:hypothetical protein